MVPLPPSDVGGGGRTSVSWAGWSGWDAEGLHRHRRVEGPRPPPPPCDIPSGCCFFTGPWTVTRSSLRMLHRVAAFCRPLRPVLLLVSFLRGKLTSKHESRR